jgi:Transposase DDE domain group 1
MRFLASPLVAFGIRGFYNKRGTAEPWIKEGKQAVKMTRLSCHRFRSNEVRLWLSVIAYNLGNLWRRLVLPKRIEKWSLTSLQQQLATTGCCWQRAI